MTTLMLHMRVLQHRCPHDQAFGLADHAASVKLLEEAYPSYEKITFSNEGY